MRMKKLANLIWELPLPTSEMLKFWQNENQAGPVGIANPKGLEWTEKGLKLNALTATVLRVSQGGAIVAPAMEEKPEFDLST